MSHPLLLDEMFSDSIATRLRSQGHDVHAVVTDPALVGLPDEQILAEAAATGRALVTANIKDFAALDLAYKATGRPHAGLIMVSTKTFPQNRAFLGAVTAALENLLNQPERLGPDRTIFLGH